MNGYYGWIKVPKSIYREITIMDCCLNSLVSSSKTSGEGEHCTFCIRTGTSKGVINRIFRAECPRDLASWARGLVQGTHNVVAAMREIAWGTF